MRKIIRNIQLAAIVAIAPAVIADPQSSLAGPPEGEQGAVLGVQANSKDSGSAQILAEALPAPAKVEETTKPVDDSPAARRAWAKTMHHTRAPREGCFKAAYPSTQWQPVQCAPPPGYRSATPGDQLTRPRKRNEKEGGHGEVGGTSTAPYSNDIVAQAPSGQFFSSATGSFISGVGIANETGVSLYHNPNPPYQDYGITGANEYTLQLNTNIAHSAACGTYSKCTAWQQYIMATNTYESYTSSTLTNQTTVFIESWLYDYGSGPNQCPNGFFDAGANNTGPGDNCYQNSPATPMDLIQGGQLPITALNDNPPGTPPDLTLSASATTNGTDEITLTYNGAAYKATVPDSYTDIASVWNQTEFNVVGDYGGAEAQFNSGTSLIVQIAGTYASGSMSAPKCVFNGGTTGESNNLNFVPSTSAPVCCTASGTNGGVSPSIQFMEVFDTHPYTASCSNGTITGEPHITTLNGTYYNFQAAGEFVALLDPNGTEVQTRQTPIPTLAPGNYDPGGLDNDGLVNCLAMNTAVAAKVGSHRVTYEPGFDGAYASGPFQLRIDGKLTTLDAHGVSLGGGGEVKNASEGGGIEVDFPDGKIMTAIPSGSYDQMNLLNVTFENLGLVSEGAGATARGLAGIVPTGSWLPALPNGKSVGPMPKALHDRYVTLYDTFANAWRVTESKSLFDYAPNTSTATFTDKTWPVENAKTCTIPNRKAIEPVSPAVAEAACKSVKEKTLHAGCVFDVQVTGNRGFADTYAVTERVHAAFKTKPIDASKLVSDVK
jgi:hypothetical protein